MRLKLIPVIAAVILAGCNAETVQNSQASSSPPVQTASATSPQIAIADGTWTGVFDKFSGVATLTVVDGKPVSYSTNSGYRAPRVSMRGNVIRVDQAFLTVDTVSEKQFTGRWVLNGARSNVVFTK